MANIERIYAKVKYGKGIEYVSINPSDEQRDETFSRFIKELYQEYVDGSRYTDVLIEIETSGDRNDVLIRRSMTDIVSEKLGPLGFTFVD